MVNVGIGIGRGDFSDADEVSRSWRNGAVPQIRFGRMIGGHFMLGAVYQGWVIEFDRFGDAVLEDAKIRRSLQDLAFGLAYFPGNQETALGGLYLRLGGGIGWSGTTIVPVTEGGKQGHGEGRDDWGTAWFGELGYEFWISRNSALGMIYSYNYFDINGDLVNTAWFSALNVTLSLYF
jgi:hypothetical protein